MPNETWPETIREALFDARIDEAVLLANCWAEEITAFVEHWGSVDADACKRALAGENVYERLFALFALGALAPTEVEALLLPFLHSPVRKERWASAIVLGRYKHEQAFPLLLAYLPEQLAYTPFAAPDEDISLDPVEMTSEAHEHVSETEWYFLHEWYSLHRYEIALLLGAYGDPRAIPVLTHTFQTGLMLEFAPPGWVSDEWYNLEDRLAYALGQLGAWHVLDELALPPKRLLIARMYLLLGSLRANILFLFSLDGLSLLCNSMERPEHFIEVEMWVRESMVRSPAQRKALRELPSLVLPICEVLQERWHFTQEECRTAFRNFFLWYGERFFGPLPETKPLRRSDLIEAKKRQRQRDALAGNEEA